MTDCLSYAWPACDSVSFVGVVCTFLVCGADAAGGFSVWWWGRQLVGLVPEGDMVLAGVLLCCADACDLRQWL